MSNNRLTAGIAAMVLVGLLAPRPGTSGASPTIVSLTFDDGLMQSDAIAALRDTGLKATFYVNSNLVRPSGRADKRDYLTKAELDELFYLGDDIGGHTIDHVDLATLGAGAQRKAVCDDLKTLRTWYGARVYSFAYPFASLGPASRAILADGCPGTYGDRREPIGKYESARSVGASEDCPSCADAEALPPPDPYFLYTKESTLANDTLAQLEDQVTRAERHGGGWVTLVFHKVCDNCDPYSIPADRLRRFLEWLKPRAARGTYVRTVHQVVSGDYPGSERRPTGASLAPQGSAPSPRAAKAATVAAEGPLGDD